MGHWEYDNKEFHNKDEMWEYLRDTSYCYSTADIERWLNQRYTASQILWKFQDALEDGYDIDMVILDIYDAYEQDEWIDNPDKPDEGEGYDYNGFWFKWIDDEEEEE